MRIPEGGARYTSPPRLLRGGEQGCPAAGDVEAGELVVTHEARGVGDGFAFGQQPVVHFGR